MFRSIDGRGNHALIDAMGSTGRPLLRLVPDDYPDDGTTPSGAHRPSARAVSNAVCDEPRVIGAGVTNFVWQWGQFLDHDIDETPVADPAEAFDIAVPTGDPYFDPDGTGARTIPLNRSFHEQHDGARQQVNEITAWIDASNVYGSDLERAQALRTLDGTGRLKTSDLDLLPFNVDGLPNAPASNVASFFLAGDFRANEQVALTAMHTLFVREHNYWADRIRRQLEDSRGHGSGNPHGGSRDRRARGNGTGGSGPRMHGAPSGERIYQLARWIVGAEMQAITYREFLPVLLGPRALRRYTGYRPEVAADISNEFATAAYRFGHSMLPNELTRIDANGETVGAGHLSLRDGFFNPSEILLEGIDSLLRGLASAEARRIDVFIVDDVRNFLFGPPGAGGFDLASLNIQRGRDHGLPGYNATRASLGLTQRTGFDAVSSDPEVRERLSTAYAHVDDIDLWVGGLAEDPAPGALLGETIRTVLTRQFEALRDGDRHYYERTMSLEWRRFIERQTLARILRRNTGIGDELPSDVFRGRGRGQR